MKTKRDTFIAAATCDSTITLRTNSNDNNNSKLAHSIRVVIRSELFIRDSFVVVLFVKNEKNGNGTRIVVVSEGVFGLFFFVIAVFFLAGIIVVINVGVVIR